MSHRSVLDDPLLLDNLSWNDIEDVFLHEQSLERAPTLLRSHHGLFDLSAVPEDNVVRQFRFQRRDIPALANALRLPEELEAQPIVRVGKIEALCIALRRLAYPIRLCDMERTFGRHMSTTSMISNGVLNHVVDTFQPLLSNLQSHKWLDLNCLKSLSSVSAMPVLFNECSFWQCSRGAPTAAYKNDLNFSCIVTLLI